MTATKLGLKGLARLLLPWRCALCAGPAQDHQELCDECDADLPRVHQSCPRCGLGIGATDVVGVCGRCVIQPPRFHRTVAPMAYDYPVDRLVLGLKFGRRIHLARALAHGIAAKVREQIEQGLLEMPASDALIPVPLHPRPSARRAWL